MVSGPKTETGYAGIPEIGYAALEIQMLAVAFIDTDSASRILPVFSDKMINFADVLLVNTTLNSRIPYALYTPNTSFTSFLAIMI